MSGGRGAAGSAPHWQCGGQGFESPRLHPFGSSGNALVSRANGQPGRYSFQGAEPARVPDPCQMARVVAASDPNPDRHTDCYCNVNCKITNHVITPIEMCR
jgi:hypothetical protein